MTTHRWTPDMVPEAARELLLAPGAPFELAVEDVLGVPTTVFRHRLPNLAALLARGAVDQADLPYLVFAGTDLQLTFADVAASAARMAHWMATEHGVGRGDVVAFAAANVPGYAVGWWATVSLGAVVAGLNGWWTPGELAYGVELAAPKLVLADGPRLDRLSGLPVQPVDIAELEPLLGPGDEQLPDPGVDEDDPVCLLFTSGTTGRPKAACLSHRNFVHCTQSVAFSGAVAAASGMAAPSSDQPASLAVSPLFHVSGCLPLATAPVAGMKMVYPPAGRWDEITHLRLTEEHRVGNWNCVPTLYWRLLQHPDFDRYDTSSLRLVGGGGAVFAPELIRLTAEKVPGARLGYGYGMSETLGSGTRLNGVHLDTHPASVGTVEALCAVQVRGEDDRPLPDGEVGEICIKGPSVFLGYWRDPEATAKALDDERWYRTGDFGHFDAEGVLYLESRMRDLIIRGGENIYPIEIENRLVEHPGIADACVVGSDHPTLGQEVVAVIVRSPGGGLDAAAVRAWVAEALASFKVPAHVLFRDELPYTATGKVVKHEVEADVTTELRRGEELRAP